MPPQQQDRLLGQLCHTWLEDFFLSPSLVLRYLRDDLYALRTSWDTRAWLVGNPTDVAELAPGVRALCPYTRQANERPAAEPPKSPRGSLVNNNLHSRSCQDADTSGFAGLLHPDTHNGTVIFSARVAAPWSTEREDLLRCLAGKYYGGGGSHGFFMRTWAAGLAYSNGYRYREGQGRVSYYAERCPDVGTTLEFVSRTLKEDAGPSHLLDYAVAQVFGPSRAADPYEDRARGMATDLLDGNDPTRVADFRKAVQELRHEPGLETELRARLTAAHEGVLIGVGKPLNQSDEGSFFLIGPEEQFQSLEKALADAGEPQEVFRLYPSDFWYWQALRRGHSGSGQVPPCPSDLKMDEPAPPLIRPRKSVKAVKYSVP